ncbi:piggyBac transposable element-derived protein 2-like [Danaus plexippus]|uniref:piggyBac transposable element-derived protein 2-like n=1 Tax=Danaus plexippus TaxID=13037 RepID=UPI002AB13C1D|nr:piggyBac transposable element-derived protein 2-like [Danaus plexippus]
MPRHLNENDIEQMLDIPDDGSEDGFESDEAEEFNVNTIQRLLEAPNDSSDLLQNSPTHLNTTPNSCSESGTSTIALCSQLDNSQPVKPLIVQSSSPLEQELTDESECEDESWGKVFWTSRPDPDEFDKVTIKPRYLLNRRARPVAHFKKFFSDEVFDLIVTQTNLYAEQQNIKNWQPVDTQEISAFLGILIIMGYHILPHIDLYWSSDPGFRVNEIAEVMPVKRFKKILETLHLNDNNQQPSREDVNFDKLYKIRPLISLLSQSFENNAFNSSSQSIDESMILFKGRSSLKQYMPLKPIKGAIKCGAVVIVAQGTCITMKFIPVKQDKEQKRV